MRYFVLVACCGLALVLLAGTCLAAEESAYVGSATCEGCHEKEHRQFMKFAKKAHSDRSVKIMAKKLSSDEVKECYGCHTTGYGKPGGFVSYEKTPDLGHAGCEVCHGPGGAHVDSGGKKGLIRGKGRMSVKDCEKCHNSERVGNFRYKPMLYGGAH